MSLSYTEKQIYNQHLKSSRSYQNKPWRSRVNFDNISPVEEELIKKINFILTTKNISPDDYFRAPYELWKDKKYYPLEYFARFKAVKAYNLWIEKLFFEDPDNEIVINMVKEGFLFIFEQCKKNNLQTIEEYFTLKTYYPEFVVALSEHNINYYNILAISNYDKILKSFPKEDVDFIVTGFYNTIDSLRARYYKSAKLKKLNEKIITKLNEILKKDGSI